MDKQPIYLHPNLAQIAASYDQLVEEYAQGKLDATEVGYQMNRLQARDDNGIVWRISPDSGQWQRRNPSNEWVEATPPVSGKPTMTSWGASRADRLEDPRKRVLHREVVRKPSWWVEQKPLQPGTNGAGVQGANMTIFVSIVILIIVVYVGLRLL